MVTGKSTRREIRELPREPLDLFPRGLSRTLGTIAEERAAPEWARAIDAAARVVAQERARAIEQRKRAACARARATERAHRAVELGYLGPRGVRLTPRDAEAAAFGAVVAREIGEDAVHLGVNGEELGAVARSELHPPRAGTHRSKVVRYGGPMSNASRRPQLRAVETIVVPDAQHGKLLVLRDTQGVANGQARIPPALIPIVARFDGQHTCEEIAREVSAELGEEVKVELVTRIADQLDEGLFLHGPTFRRARAEVERQFADAEVRAATHAGGAYLADPAALREYLEKSCLDRAKPRSGARAHGGKSKPKPLAGLIAPHIDPWRGALGYGHAYAALAARLPPAADTFVLLGTSHAPMKEPFALCKKAFATPLGDIAPDRDALDLLAKSATFDPYADQFNHKREHSLEFQAVFLKHLLDSAPSAARGEARIVPILAGLGQQQAMGTDPMRDSGVMKFLNALRDFVASRPGRVVVIAGADLAHVGPRFGDAKPLAQRQRDALEQNDRTSLDHAASGDASAFWKDVAKDLETRRVCGLAPIYSLLRALPGCTGELLHYEQTIDEEDGSIVSHAGVGFTIA